MNPNKPLTLEALQKAAKIASRQFGKTQLLVNQMAYNMLLNDIKYHEAPIERLKRFLKENDYEKS